MSLVTVGCKLPNGLHLDHAGKRFTLRGANASELIGGHGLTQIPADFWEAWATAHADFEPLKQGLIFAEAKANDAKAAAEDNSENKSGFEGIDPKNPGAGLKPADEEK